LTPKVKYSGIFKITLKVTIRKQIIGYGTRLGIIWLSRMKKQIVGTDNHSRLTTSFFHSQTAVFKVGYLPGEGKIFALLWSNRIDTALIFLKENTLAILF